VSEDVELVNLGSCCSCQKEGPEVRNAVMLDKRAVISGHGWGCFVCGLPNDGAVYVQCDECLSRNRPAIWACRGYPATEGRILIEHLMMPFEHDMSKHGRDE